MHPKDGFATLQIWIPDGHLTIEAAGPEQGRIQDVLPVGRGDDDDAEVRLETVHFDQQLVERLFPFFVAERVATAAAPDRVDFVDENDAGLDGAWRP